MTRATRFFLLLIVLSAAGTVSAAEVPKGYHPTVKVSAATRLDWVFAVANQSPKVPPASLLKDYDSTAQSYELYVPKSKTPQAGWPVVLFISPGGKSAGWGRWKSLCEKRGVVFIGVHGAGNSTPMPRRIRIVMDVFDDVRRRYKTDADRTYVSGFSGGARIACAIGFAVSEHFGGVIPICAGGELRGESWLRQRVIDRVSVAFVTGEGDFNRGEVEHFRGPMLAEVGVRSRVWVVPKMGHSIPNSDALEPAFNWVEEAVKERRAWAKRYPASRISGETSLKRDEWAVALMSEAKTRMKNPKTFYSGLMQMKGAMARWPDLPTASEARKTLIELDSRKERPWEQDDLAEQRRFLIANARGLSSYAEGTLPRQYQAQRPGMAEAAIRMWVIVIRDGQNKAAVAEGRRKVESLRKFLTK
jgi:predicted esterase